MTMKLVRFDSPEIARSITPSAALACWGWIVGPLIYASVLGLLFSFGISFISGRAVIWLGAPVFLALNGYMFWRARSPRLNWVVAGSADHIFVRFFLWRGKKRDDPREPDMLVLEASEIASMSVKIVDVFLYGPKPKIVEWLVIEPVEAIAKEVSDLIRPLQGAGPNLCGIRPIDLGKQALVAIDEGHLTMEWKPCRPALRIFLQQVARECPSVVLGPEERSELDLNGIWHGFRAKPNAEQRRMLVQTIRLGFGSECLHLLSVYRSMSRAEAREYLADAVREEAENNAPLFKA